MSDKEREFAQKIKDSYTEKPKTKIEELKSLDKQAKQPAIIFAYVYGVIGALILGVGMCLAMKVIGASISALMPIGIIIGVLGIIMVSTTNLLYGKILKRRKAKFSSEIIARSEELLNNN